MQQKQSGKKAKIIISGIVILTIGAVVLGGNNRRPIESGTSKDEIESREVVKISKGELISFQLYKSYKVDTSGFYERFHIVEETPFTYFVQTYDLEGLRRVGDFSEIYSKLPRFDDVNPTDYKDKFLAASFGREVVEIEVIKEAVLSSESVEAAITFADEYHDQTMFLYIMDKIHLLEGLGSEFYFMNGSEKVFAGESVLDLNKTTSE